LSTILVKLPDTTLQEKPLRGQTPTVVSRDFAKATKIDVETAVEAVISGHGLGYEGND
jgi:hypothetical protein